VFVENKITEFKREYVEDIKIRLLHLQTVMAVHFISE